jgi:hypothetical protein
MFSSVDSKNIFHYLCLITVIIRFQSCVCDEEVEMSAEIELDSGDSMGDLSGHSVVRRRIKAMHLTPKNGSVVWADTEICNVDLRFEVHGGTISFTDRVQMVSGEPRRARKPRNPITESPA